MKLVCPVDMVSLQRQTGSLFCPKCHKTYEIKNEILRFAGEISSAQAQVKSGFAFKWSRDQWGFHSKHIQLMQGFFWDRFGFSSENDVEDVFKDKLVLHAGIGNGQAEQHYLSCCREVWGVDISESIDACQKNWRQHYPGLTNKLHLLQSDLMAMPFPDNSFDIVFSDGVLHHTPNTFKALQAITTKVRNGGIVMFYVYRKKPPIREFVDDYIREKISLFEPAEAWLRLEPLTELARQLSSQSLTIQIPKDIELLEMFSGEYDLQRWLYFHVMKFYWNDNLSFDENNHVNFDWYYPRYAWRHTPEEIQGWLINLNLKLKHFHVGDSGISVIAQKGE